MSEIPACARSHARAREHGASKTPTRTECVQSSSTALTASTAANAATAVQHPGSCARVSARLGVRRCTTWTAARSHSPGSAAPARPCPPRPELVAEVSVADPLSESLGEKPVAGLFSVRYLPTLLYCHSPFRRRPFRLPYLSLPDERILTATWMPQKDPRLTSPVSPLHARGGYCT